MFSKAGKVSIFSFVKVQKENLSNVLWEETFKTHITKWAFLLDAKSIWQIDLII